MQIVRMASPTGDATLGLVDDGGLVRPFPTAGIQLRDVLRLPADKLRALVDAAARAEPMGGPAEDLLAPVEDGIEVWAAGVTYQRSEEARIEESGTPDIYTRVYHATRPELFFKANARRVARPRAPICVRADSTWDVPEPELALVINRDGEIVGYTIGDDVSSRSIEGENPLYLPQAKVYAGCCALGPGITPQWEVPEPYRLTIRMSIQRHGAVTWHGETSTSELKRRSEELAEYLFREDEFPDGAILCTGTALVPERPFTLEPGDVVEITIDRLGTLRNPVVRGKAAFLQSAARSTHAL